MKLFIQLIVCLFITAFASAQDPIWEEQESGTTQTLRDICFVSNTTGYIVGDAGTVLKTENSGEEWSQIDAGLTGKIVTVCFVNEQTGFIGGDNENPLYKTTDGGLSWEPLDHGLGNDPIDLVNDIYFIDENIGFVGVNSGMSKTVDGGATWEPLADSIFLVEKINFYDNLIGYATCANGILKTIDGGQSWNLHKAAGEPDFDDGAIIRSIQAMAPDTVFFGAPYYSSFYSSIDGGQSLNHQSISIKEMDFLNSKTGFALSQSNTTFYSTIIKTTDMGENWVQQFEYPSPQFNDFYALWMKDEQEGWVAGHNGLILHLVPSITNNLEELDQINLTLYPNPTTNMLTIATEDFSIDNLQIFDINGRLCSFNRNGASNIDVSNLTPGIYYLYVESEGRVKSITFVKE